MTPKEYVNLNVIARENYYIYTGASVILYKDRALVAQPTDLELHVTLNYCSVSGIAYIPKILDEEELIAAESALRKDENISLYLTSPSRVVRAYTEIRLEELCDSSSLCSNR